MRVAFLTPELPPGPSGGIGVFVDNLSRCLARAGHQPHVILLGDGPDYKADGVRIQFVRPTRIPKLGWILNRQRLRAKINHLIAKEGVQIVEAPDWSGLSAGMRLRCPIVVRCHGSETYFAHLLGYQPRRVTRTMESRALHGADALASVSCFAGEVTRAIFRCKKHFETIYNGIDLDQFGSGGEICPQHGRLLFVGTLVRKKGVLDVCSAFNEICIRHPESTLVIVGRDAADKATGERSLWKLCQKLLSSDAYARVRYFGALPNAEIRTQILQSAVCILPSYAESFGLTLVESMACSRPVVAYDLEWAREVVDPGTTALLVPPGNVPALAEAVSRLLKDTQLAESLGRSGRRRAESFFSINRAADESVRWFQRVIRKWKCNHHPS